MEQTELMKEIEKIRKQADIEAKEYVEILEQEKPEIEAWAEQKVLSINYRIKSIESILEKIEYLKTRYFNKGKTDLEILQEMKDIIGITIETEQEDYAAIAVEVVRALCKSKNLQDEDLKKSRIYERDNDTFTGYKMTQMFWNLENRIPFEIQISDPKNIAVRNNTHEEFKKEKYKSIRNPAEYKQEMQDLYRALIADLKILYRRAEHEGEELKSKRYQNAYRKLEFIRQRRGLAPIGQSGGYREVYNMTLQIVEEYKRKRKTPEAIEHIIDAIEKLCEIYEIHDTKETNVEKNSEPEIE